MAVQTSSRTLFQWAIKRWLMTLSKSPLLCRVFNWEKVGLEFTLFKCFYEATRKVLGMDSTNIVATQFLLGVLLFESMWYKFPSPGITHNPLSLKLSRLLTG
jgi:hypothetical protein